MWILSDFAARNLNVTEMLDKASDNEEHHMKLLNNSKLAEGFPVVLVPKPPFASSRSAAV
jgi:hypothetical protein